jgi:hypothetical protein
LLSRAKRRALGMVLLLLCRDYPQYSRNFQHV